jgi:hypothetical protein
VSDAAVLFQLDSPAGNPPARLVYRPWGTRSLKVVVRTASALPPLRLRPATMLASESDMGIFRGFADDSRALVVTWGGGHEPGPCVCAEDYLIAFEKPAVLAPGATSVVFFNVSHVGPTVPGEATVTLEAFDASGTVWARLPVTLAAPTALPSDVVRMVETAPAVWMPTADGHLAAYDSRWWPAVDVDYVAHAAPPLAIRRAEHTLGIYWANAAVPIATIVDRTEPSILDRDAITFEVFAFANDLIALRAMFFWVDTRIGSGFFVGRHEVPDAERFDMLIRPADGRVVLACTDAHWREVWGEVPEPPAPTLEMTIGLDAEAKLKLLELCLMGGAPHAGPAVVGTYDPRPFVESRAAARAQPGESPEGAGRAEGTEAHLPALNHVAQDAPAAMTSSDVRLG